MQATLKQKTITETYHYEVIINGKPKEFSITYLDGLSESINFNMDGLNRREISQSRQMLTNLIDELDVDYKLNKTLTAVSNSMFTGESLYSTSTNKHKLEDI